MGRKSENNFSVQLHLNATQFKGKETVTVAPVEWRRLGFVTQIFRAPNALAVRRVIYSHHQWWEGWTACVAAVAT